ncbi:hypothetical protein NQZ79_g5568 [Umbelopsis isabellina]|nr:hypothetical protein NQZ79_g5568 [Umbelopsis isabellina]
MSLGRILARKRERRKSNSPKVQEAEKKLSTCSTEEANNVADVLQRHQIGQEQRQELREFYYSKRQKKEHHTAHLLLGRAYDRIASKERRFIAGHSKGKKTPCAAMCIGQAGTGVGSRIGGHQRYGGSQLRRRHRRYAVVAMTNEHNSSQTCSVCMSPVVRPQQRIQIKGKWRTRSVNGSSVCFNTNCPSYKSGCNTKNRDVEAAVCIALAGVSTMLSGHTLPPFTRNTSQSYTGQAFNRVPPVTGAALVPATAGLP